MRYQDFIIRREDAPRILSGSDRRLSPREFAQGLIAILAVWAVFEILSLLPVVGPGISILGLLVSIALAYFWVCVYAKRFHDAGRSGWLTLAVAAIALLVTWGVNYGLGPLLGGPAPSLAAGSQDLREAYILQTLVIGLIINAALGFAVYSLPRKPVD